MKEITVGAFLQSFENPFRAVVVKESDTIRSVVETMIANKEERGVYVVDENARLSGIISVGSLTRHIMHEEVSPHTGFTPAANILHYLTAEHAGDIMECDVISCSMDELLSTVAAKMSGKKLFKMLPVVDGEGHIVDLLNILDMLEYGFE